MAGKRGRRGPRPRGRTKAERLSAAAWVEAAFDAIADGGLAAVAVEPLARGLDVTKGSFYWHFASADELLHAALELWTTRDVDEVLAELDALAEPQDRARRFFVEVPFRAGLAGRQLVLAAACQVPAVAATVDEAVRRRVAWLTRLFRDLGHPPQRVSARAWLAHEAWIGQLHVARCEAADVRRERERHRDEILSLLIGSTDGSSQSGGRREAAAAAATRSAPGQADADFDVLL